jgi:pyruvate kinase
MRRTKIVATIGPASDSPEVLDALLAAGLDVARLNASHSGPAELGVRLRAIREASERAGREVGVLLDLPGPKLRIGEVEEGTLLEEGADFSLIADECVGDSHHACVSYPSIADELEPGDHVLIDDGRIVLEVVGSAPGELKTRVQSGGVLLGRKGINIPDATLSIEAVTPYDRTIMSWGIANGVDYIGQSFVRNATDIDVLRKHMGNNEVPIVAKIEKHEAALRLEAIAAVADAVMVARGDLGAETSPEQVPVLQQRIVKAARKHGKPVIVATQMLESMITSPRPTRAEASDVATAIFQGADAVMLSAETATGKYPVEAVETMARIAKTAEAEVLGGYVRSAGGEHDIQEAVSAAVVDIAEDLKLAWIVSVTQTGATATVVSRHRPRTPIVAVTPEVAVARKLQLVWNVLPLVMKLEGDTDEIFDAVTARLREEDLVAPGERIAFTAGRASNEQGGTDLIQVRTV